MGKAKPHYLKRRNILFATKKAFCEHLNAIYQKAKKSQNKIIEDENDILDLIDYLEDYHNDRDTIQNEFNFENCEFYVAKSPDYTSECLWIRDKTNLVTRQFSITNFGNPSTPLQNLVSCFSYLIFDIKKKIRIEITEREGKDFEEYNLWHKEPTTKEIVQEFIYLHYLENKLEQVISPNGLGNNVAFLMPDYAYLAKEFLDFYMDKKASNELKYQLKEIKV